MEYDYLKGKNIVVTAGWPREDIDGVRHFANHHRLESQGYAVAAWLAAQGANVTIIAPKNSSYPPPAGCHIVQEHRKGHPISSGWDLMQMVEDYTDDNPTDVVFLLASVSSIKPPKQADQKIKAKDGKTKFFTMQVVGNANVERLAHTWRAPALGFNSWEERFRTANTPDWAVGAGFDYTEHLNDACVTMSLKMEKDIFSPGKAPNLRNKKVIITGGPTEEVITTAGDVITNFSSGRQGHEMARAFAEAGAKVVYVLGQTSLPAPMHKNIRVVLAPTAKAMLAACEDELPADIFVGVAAVADFGCIQPYDFYQLLENVGREIKLTQNPDILSAMGHHPKHRPDLVIGFAAETDPDNILDYAKGKLDKKNADIIYANLVGRGKTFGKEENQVIFVTKGAAPRLSNVMDKRDVAAAIVREVAARLPCKRDSVMKTKATTVSCARK